MEEELTLQDVLDLGGTEVRTTVLNSKLSFFSLKEDFALLQEEDGDNETGNISQSEVSFS